MITVRFLVDCGEFPAGTVLSVDEVSARVLLDGDRAELVDASGDEADEADELAD